MHTLQWILTLYNGFIIHIDFRSVDSSSIGKAKPLVENRGGDCFLEDCLVTLCIEQKCLSYEDKHGVNRIKIYLEVAKCDSKIERLNLQSKTTSVISNYRRNPYYRRRSPKSISSDQYVYGRGVLVRRKTDCR